MARDYHLYKRYWDSVYKSTESLRTYFSAYSHVLWLSTCHQEWKLLPKPENTTILWRVSMFHRITFKTTGAACHNQPHQPTKRTTKSIHHLVSISSLKLSKYVYIYHILKEKDYIGSGYLSLYICLYCIRCYAQKKKNDP